MWTSTTCRDMTSAEIVKGACFNLSLPLNLPDPSFGSRGVYRHHMFSPQRNVQDDVLDNFFLQGSSQWDGLRHIGAREFGFYNSVSADDAGPNGRRLGIDRWADHGIVGRGVLLDVAAYRAKQGAPLNAREEFLIDEDLLEAVAADQKVDIRRADIILLRTGYLEAYLAATPAERKDFMRHGDSPGLVANENMARFLWDHHVAAVVADNHGFESTPGVRGEFLHRRLIALLGFAIGEWFNFETLATDCREDGRYTCFFMSAPLNLPGGVGSPANAIALK
jgi:kynurenine formamidase